MKNPTHGGKRKGAGPKRKLVDGHRVMVYLDSGTITTMSRIGGGNLSAGIRKAGQIVLQSGKVK